MTGEKLGARGPAVKVDLVTEVAQSPSFSQKCLARFRAPEPPNRVVTTVYVCCPECVAKVKADSNGYSLKVYAERRGLLKCCAAAGPAGGEGQKEIPAPTWVPGASPPAQAQTRSAGP